MLPKPADHSNSGPADVHQRCTRWPGDCAPHRTGSRISCYWRVDRFAVPALRLPSSSLRRAACLDKKLMTFAGPCPLRCLVRDGRPPFTRRSLVSGLANWRNVGIPSISGITPSLSGDGGNDVQTARNFSSSRLAQHCSARAFAHHRAWLSESASRASTPVTIPRRTLPIDQGTAAQRKRGGR